MLNLLRAERLKLQGGRKFWLVVGLVIILPIFQLLNSLSKNHYQGGLTLQVDQVVNGASAVLMPLKSNLLILLLFCAFISFYIGEEFETGTIRNPLSLGTSRLKFYLTKLAVTLGLTALTVIVVTGLSMLGYGLVFGFGKIAGVTSYDVYFWLVLVTLFSLLAAGVAVYVAISFMTQKIGPALIWSFVYTIGMGLVPGVFQKINGLESVTWWFTESYLFYVNFTRPQVLDLVPKMLLVSWLTVLIASLIGYQWFKRSNIK